MARRWTVVGQSGSGKSTLARDIADAHGVPAIELDELFHGPDWTPTPTPEFRARVADALAAAEQDGGGWVVAGNYVQVADLTHGRADVVVWIDLPRRLPALRVWRRSWGRVLRRTELWNGNRESWAALFSRDPERNPALWSWRSHGELVTKYEALADGPLWRDAEVVRLRSRAEVERFRCSIGADDR